MQNEEFDICYSINIFLSNDYERYNKKIKNIDLINENVLVIKDLIDNLIYFNKKYKIIIMLNGCKELDYNIKLINTIKSYKNVLLKTNSGKRFWGHYSILGGYIENYNFMKQKKINYKYLILLTGNCYLVKQFNLENLNFDNKINPKIKKKFHFKQMYERNKNIYNFFKKINFHKYSTCFHHEGVCYPIKKVDKIFNFIFEKFHNKKDFIERSDFNNSYNFIAEETLLPLCEYYFFKKKFPRIINFRKNKINESIFSSLDENTKKVVSKTLNQKGKFGIKPILRIIDYPDRKFLKNIK